MRYLSLFTGIGAFEKALSICEIPYTLVGFSEIDKFAIASYCAMHGVDPSLNLGDVSKIDATQLKDIDLITHGSPCQSYSIAGRGEGGDKDSGTRSSLMWYTVDIVREIKPKYVIWENVKGVLSVKHKHNFDTYLNDLESLGYNNYYKVLNAKDFAIPQNRERIFVISIRKDIDTGNFVFPEPFDSVVRLKDFLEREVDEKYYIDTDKCKILLEKLNFEHVEKRACDLTTFDPEFKDIANCITAKDRGIKQFKSESNGVVDPIIEPNECKCVGECEGINGHDILKRVYSPDGCSPTIPTCCGGNQHPKVAIPITTPDRINVRQNGRRCKTDGEPMFTLTAMDRHGVIESNVTKYRIRRLTPKECFRLQAFTDIDFQKCKDINMSDTQLYKQAGNSICVSVLIYIFNNLFKGDKL